MKKIFAVAASLVLVVVSANSQSEKKEPPPPPPKPKEEVKYKEEKVKNTSPTVIDEKVNASKPPDPPVVTVKGKGADDFYKRNPTVAGISRQGSVITIKKKRIKALQKNMEYLLSLRRRHLLKKYLKYSH